MAGWGALDWEDVSQMPSTPKLLAAAAGVFYRLGELEQKGHRRDCLKRANRRDNHRLHNAILLVCVGRR